MTIDLNPTEDQRRILDSAAALLADRFPVARLRRGAPEPLDALAEFGAFALAAPDEIGGAGLSLVEEALLHVAFGRHLVGPGALATAIGARLAFGLGLTDLAEAAAAGTARFALAIPSGDGLLVVDAAGAGHAVCWSAETMTLVDLGRLPLAPADGIDASLTLARSGPREQAVAGTLARPELARAADLLVSAELLGIAEALRDMAVGYAGIRTQFGRPIGSFQAIKHRCADMAIGAAMLSAQLDFAAIAERDGRPDAAFQTAALRLLAPRVALAAAHAAIQIHGGIGFSAECDAHLYLKRAHLLARTGGGAGFLDLASPLAPLGKETPCASP